MLLKPIISIPKKYTLDNLNHSPILLTSFSNYQPQIKHTSSFLTIHLSGAFRPYKYRKERNIQKQRCNDLTNVQEHNDRIKMIYRLKIKPMISQKQLQKRTTYYMNQYEQIYYDPYTAASYIENNSPQHFNPSLSQKASRFNNPTTLLKQAKKEQNNITIQQNIQPSYFLQASQYVQQPYNIKNDPFIIYKKIKRTVKSNKIKQEVSSQRYIKNKIIKKVDNHNMLKILLRQTNKNQRVGQFKQDQIDICNDDFQI